MDALKLAWAAGGLGSTVEQKGGFGGCFNYFFYVAMLAGLYTVVRSCQKRRTEDTIWKYYFGQKVLRMCWRTWQIDWNICRWHLKIVGEQFQLVLTSVCWLDLLISSSSNDCDSLSSKNNFKQSFNTTQQWQMWHRFIISSQVFIAKLRLVPIKRQEKQWSIWEVQNVKLINVTTNGNSVWLSCCCVTIVFL